MTDTTTLSPSCNCSEGFKPKYIVDKEMLDWLKNLRDNPPKVEKMENHPKAKDPNKMWMDGYSAAMGDVYNVFMHYVIAKQIADEEGLKPMQEGDLIEISPNVYTFKENPERKKWLDSIKEKNEK